MGRLSSFRHGRLKNPLVPFSFSKIIPLWTPLCAVENQLKLRCIYRAATHAESVLMQRCCAALLLRGEHNR
jgi:hypothetical protein